MASKRLSKLKVNELEPSEKGLSVEELEFNLNVVLSVTTDDDLKKWEREKVKSKRHCLPPWAFDQFLANGPKTCDKSLKEKLERSTDSEAWKIKEGSTGTFGNSISSMPSGITDSEDGSDESSEQVDIIELPKNSISRGYSISVIRQRKTNIKFDIVETRIVDSHPKKHVLYLVVVTQTPGIDSDKAIIERRYSEFHKFYKALKKISPAFIKTLDFPEKKYHGNLDKGLIHLRCQKLQMFLQATYEKEEIRTSDTFKHFFYIASLKQGCQYICGGHFEEALTFLLNGLHLQQKLALDSGKDEVIATLCNIVECYMSSKQYEEVVKYSQAVLELIEDSTSSIYLVPLLQTLKEARVALGENANETKTRLREIINLNQIEIEHVASLRELAVMRFTKK